MRRAKSLWILASFLICGLVHAADTYIVDKAHTNVGFTAKHLVISKVHGRFTDFSGTILFDEQDVTKSTVQGTIKVASLTTENENRDKHLKSGDFFDAEKYPEIAFTSKKIEKKGDGYIVHGTLTIRGVSKDVSFPATVTGPIKDPGGNKRIGLEANLKINRQDFGVSWNKTMDNGGLVVSDEVEIRLDSEAATQSETKKEG